jgi:hypothetical protein
VNLDLTALPVDVDALHRLVRELAAQVADDDTALAAARAEVDRLQLIIQRACARATSASTSSNPRASWSPSTRPATHAVRTPVGTRSTLANWVGGARGGLAEAIRYTLSRWTALCRFLDDGRIDLDNNPVERAIRPVALGRKNHLFAGSDGGGARWATVCALITTAKLNNVEPFAYLRDILERMTDGHPMSRLDDLLPWNWAKKSVNQ